MTSRSTVPAVEYRNLVVQLGLRLELDPDNSDLRQLMQDLVAIGDGAGALTLKLDASEDVLPHTGGAHPVPTFDWENGAIPVSPHQEKIVARVAEITNVPE
ncbi:MAG: hypothetical protein M3Z20_09675 [Chloroflexota bacterium]|nr:hypothetical protein [Chloroflexota bacterium]